MLERGATTVLAELCPTAAADGRCDALLPEILVFTNIFPERATAGGAASAAAGTGSGEEATVVGFAEDSVEGYVERVAAMFDRLTDPERQRAVVNIDGEALDLAAALACPGRRGQLAGLPGVGLTRPGTSKPTVLTLPPCPPLPAPFPQTRTAPRLRSARRRPARRCSPLPWTTRPPT